MNILFIVPYVPSLIRVRPYQIIRALLTRGHQVTVLTLWTNAREQSEVEHLQQLGAEVHAVEMPIWRSLGQCLQALPGSDPLQAAYSWSPALIQPYLQRNGTPYDVVHVEHLRGARYGLAFKQQGRAPVVWDSVDCITHLFTQAATQSQDRLRRWRSQFELERTRGYESKLVTQFDRVLVTSPTDRDMLQKLGGSAAAPITVLANGVDLDYFQPAPTTVREPATLILSGKMSYHANISMAMYMARDILPRVWRQQPDVRLLIVGKDPTREILHLGQHPNITVTGTVDHLPPYIQRSTIAVAPITYSAGIQNKILESMACATPVITTPQALAGLKLRVGHDVLAAADAAAFAQQILDLLGNSEKQQQLGRNGRIYVETHHRWSQAGEQLEAIYAETIAANRRDAAVGSPHAFLAAD